MADPPPHEEGSHCRVCNCAFTTFKRRHHCRCCGRSLCNEHSSNQKALPQFGIYTPVRVCDECCKHPKPRVKPATENSRGSVDDASASISKLNLSEGTSFFNKDEEATPAPPATPAFECTCGMPLCICEAPTPIAEVVAPYPVANVASAKPKKVSATQNPTPLARTSSYGSTMPSLFFQSGGQPSQGTSRAFSNSYDFTGEGLREAVKAGDVSAVKDLLARGLSANYVDKQGMSLLHLAAMFNFTEITFILMDAGANVQAKNSQGETAVDCAQTTLGYKMQQRLDNAKR